MKLTKEIIIKAKVMYDYVSSVSKKNLPIDFGVDDYHKRILDEAADSISVKNESKREAAMANAFCLIASLTGIVEGDENEERWRELAQKTGVKEEDFSALVSILDNNINAEAIKEISDGKTYFEDEEVVEAGDLYKYSEKYKNYKYTGEMHIDLFSLYYVNSKLGVKVEGKEFSSKLHFGVKKEAVLNEQINENPSQTEDSIQKDEKESKNVEEFSMKDDSSEIDDNEIDDESKIEKSEKQEDIKIDFNNQENNDLSKEEISTEKKEEPSKDEIKINDTNQTKEDLSNEESTSELTEDQFDNVMEIYNDYKRGDSTMWEILDEKLDDLKQDKKQYKEYAYKNIETYRFVSMYLAFDKARSERSFLSYFNPYNWYKYPKENRQINIIKEKLAENGVTDESLADYKKQFENMFNESKLNNRSMDKDENSFDNSQDGIETDEKIPGLDKEFKEVNRNSSTKQVDNPTKEIDISKNN